MHCNHNSKDFGKFNKPQSNEKREMQQTVATTALIHYLVSTYYGHLSSVLIVYDGSALDQNATVQQDYLDAVQQAFHNQSQHGKIIGLQWMNVKYLKDIQTKEQNEYDEQILNAVNIVTEGFITILTNTSRFLHARYYATRYATLRLKDKIYLFLCEHENPKEFLASEILQFYPHHLMVIPTTTIYPTDFDTEHWSDNINKTTNDNKTTTTTATKTKTKTQKSTTTTTTTTRQTFFIRQEEETLKNFILMPTDEQKSTLLMLHNGNDNNRDINFQLWTQKYVGTTGNLNATYLDTFIGRSLQFARNAQLYPNKLWNLQQRTMRIGTLTYVPYVKTNYVTPGTGDMDGIDSNGPSKSVLFQGGEAEIMKTFCHLRNCHLRIQPYPADNWGIIFDNGSTEGMLGDLYKQETEMAIGCVYNWYNNITEVSQFIARSAVTVLGPGPEQFPRWRTNIMPFSTEVWLLLAITLLLCSIMFHFIKYAAFHFKHIHSARINKYGNVKKFEKSMLDIFAVFIQQPSAETALHRFASRVFLAFLMCATITLENTYSGQLKSILTTPLFMESIDTIDKWSQTDWKWAAPSIIWIQTVENSDIAKEQRMAKHFEVRDREFMYNASFRDDYGFGIERLYSGALNFGDYITVPVLDRKIIPNDDLYFDWTRAVAIRGWPFMPLLDSHILYCLETGLYIYWERLSSIRMLDDQIQDILIKLANNYKPKSPPQKLSIENISGPLFILLFGYFSAVVIFFFELFQKRLREFWFRGKSPIIMLKSNEIVNKSKYKLYYCDIIIGSIKVH